MEMGQDGYRYKNGEKLSMTIQTVAGWSDYILINDTLKQQLKPLGIEIVSSQMAWNQWNENEQKGNYQLSLDSLGLGVTSDPYYTYSPRYTTDNMAKVGDTSGGQNYARYSNPVVDKAVANAAATEDEAERKAQYAIVQQEITNDVPVHSRLYQLDAHRIQRLQGNRLAHRRQHVRAARRMEGLGIWASSCSISNRSSKDKS